VRGWLRAKVAALLIASATVSGALAGFAAGAVWAGLGLPRPTVPIAVVVVTLALAADVAPWARPLAVNRQVPREWSRLFAPPTVAILYGARLGVGPLTILPTWLWWAAFLLAMAAGPFAAVVAGATFGAVRGVSMVGVAEWLRPDTPPRMARLQSWEGRVALATLPVVVVTIVVVA
jgi:hypothetical protein